MPYVEPTSRSTGYLVTAANWNQDVVSNVSFLANPPACHVYHNISQNIADSTETTVDFNSERYDTDSMHGATTTRITFNTAGLYIVGFQLDFGVVNDWVELYASLRLNGSTILSTFAWPAFANSTFAPILQAVTTQKFAATDYVEVRAYQNNTTNAARAILNTGQRSANLWATWVGRG